MFLVALMMLAEAAPIVVVPVAVDPATMSRDQIKAHNQALTRADPDYIRCQRYAAPGSLIENKQTCRTNRQWAEADRRGNDAARDAADRMRGSEPPAEPLERGRDIGI